MSEILTRHPETDEIPLLKSLWSSVFGNIGIDAFFCLFFKPELCVVIEQNGSLAAMGYLIPSGNIKTVSNSSWNERLIKCAMIYSVGTLPEYRSMGLGTIIVNKLINLAGESGYDSVVLCPSEDGLFEYYGNRTKLRDWFYVNESVLTKPPVGKPTVLPTNVSIDEYMSVRENLPAEIIYIQQEEKHFKYQLDLCNELGGGLFRIGDFYAVIERQSKTVVWVKELLMPDNGMNSHNVIYSDIDFTKALASVAHMFPADEYMIRTLAKSGTGQRFGMLNLCGSVPELLEKNEFAPWYGMAFD
jgi:GNAT superfamily N-acetyltransferase